MKLQDPWAPADSLRGQRVLLAMSGGVDSSAAAALLVRRGAVVVGLTMKNFCYSEAGAGEKSCCSVSHMLDARAVCESLGIEHYVIDTSESFGRLVMDRFVEEYEDGRTPNPCVDCNQSVRFPQLVAKARELGTDLVATGHYARVGEDESGRRFVMRARDTAKDQSYFLYGVPRRCLEQTVFPLGGLTKDEVRQVARDMGLATADKPESQEICFLPDGNRGAFLEERTSTRPGPVVDLQGRHLGTHDGIGRFTVGQRRGLGIAAAHALYVHRIDRASDTVVLGDEESLYSAGLRADRFWLGVEPSCAGLTAQIRYRHPPVGVTRLEVESAGRARMQLARPQRAVAPGQAVVLYVEDAIVGGGRIMAAVGQENS